MLIGDVCLLHAVGGQQSPIELAADFDAESLKVSVGWQGLLLSNYEDKFDPSRKAAAQPTPSRGRLVMDGERYVPVDCHVHFPAEHMIRGSIHAGEVHIVHVHEDDLYLAQAGSVALCRIAVLGVLLEEGGGPYEPVSSIEASSVGNQRVAREDLLPPNPSAIRYVGSLTTPPFSENVTFVIFEQAMTASPEQVRQTPRNVRTLHERNRRYRVRGKVEMEATAKRTKASAKGKPGRAKKGGKGKKG